MKVSPPLQMGKADKAQPKKAELLCPGGDLEKLKIAIRYGADACYIAGENYGLRTRAGNFTTEEMREAVDFAHRHNAKVYVVANMLTHEGDERGVEDFFRDLAALAVDAVLIADPGLIEICQSVAPHLAIHLSTQASALNYLALQFWEEAGLERVVLGREVSFDELVELKAKTSIELECFVHGAMCVGYSGRCVLSNHMLGRDANRGGCAQPCRWFYELYRQRAAGESVEASTASTGKQFDCLSPVLPFSLSAADLSLLPELPKLLELGVDSLKIEGRMKSIHYVSTVANVYRQAIDSYYQDPDNYQVDPAWLQELSKVARRNLASGFFYGEAGVSEQSYQDAMAPSDYSFVGQVLHYDQATGIATVEQRNKFALGDCLEFYGPGFHRQLERVEWMENAKGERIEACPHPQMLVRLPVSQAVAPYYLVRKVNQK